MSGACQALAPIPVNPALTFGGGPGWTTTRCPTSAGGRMSALMRPARSREPVRPCRSGCSGRRSARLSCSCGFGAPRPDHVPGVGIPRADFPLRPAPSAGRGLMRLSNTLHKRPSHSAEKKREKREKRGRESFPAGWPRRLTLAQRGRGSKLMIVGACGYSRAAIRLVRNGRALAAGIADSLRSLAMARGESSAQPDMADSLRSLAMAPGGISSRRRRATQMPRA